MPQTPHVERHFTASGVVRDIVIGMSDGLTVPFALAAGLSGAVESSAIIVTAGLAEVAAGAIAMGLGGYLAARTDAEHYVSERAREEKETEEMPEKEAAEVADVLRSYGLENDKVAAVVASIRANKKRWSYNYAFRWEEVGNGRRVTEQAGRPGDGGSRMGRPRPRRSADLLDGGLPEPSGPRSKPGRVGRTADVPRGVPHRLPPGPLEPEDRVRPANRRGDRVVSQMVLRADHSGPLFGHPPTGRAVTLASIRIDRFEGGRIAEHWSVADMAGFLAGFLQQLGPAAGSES